MSIEIQQQFRDCSTYEERWQWIQSPQGQRVLSVRPKIQELYLNGKLQIMIRDPHWIQQLNQWLRVPTNSRFDIPTASAPAPFTRSSGGAVAVTHHAMSSLHYSFTEAQKLDFLIHGYFVVPNVIPDQILLAAINFLRSKPTSIEGHRHLISEFSTDQSILDLFYKTPVQAMADSLFHGNKPHFPTIVHQAQIAQRPPQSPPSLSIFNFGGRKAEGGKRWHIDGLSQGKHSPFVLLIGVALSDQLVENSGNLTVFPGSHHTLLPFLNEFVKAGYLPEVSGQPTGPLAFEMYENKPSLDSPVQVLIAKGDVILIHQKVAHRGGANYSNQTRDMIYFRVSSSNHQEVMEQNLSNIWIEFQGLADIL